MKKVLSLVLVIAMVLSSMSFAFASTLSDVAGNDYEDAINTMVAFGVIQGYEDGTFRAERTVTRAEMAKILVEALGYGKLTAGATSNFADTQGHWADKWISIAVGTNLVVGYPDGNFKPDATVTYDEVLTMVVRALGYTDASLKGAWPTNFKVKAYDLGLTDDVKMATALADRGGVVQVLYNALDVNLVQVDADNKVSFIELDKNNYKTLVDQLGTKDDYDITTDSIDADSKNYLGDIVDLAPYMYQNITAYANKNGDIVYVKSVNSLTFAGTVTAVAKDGTTITVENADEDEYKFKTTSGSSIDFMFNGKEVSKYDSSKLLADEAEVTVVLKGEDGDKIKDDIEVLAVVAKQASGYVQVEETYVKGDVNLDVIYLPEDDDEVDFANLKIEGDATELEDIKKDDVLTVYVPLDVDFDKEAASNMTIVVTRDVVEGRVTKVSGSDYYIGGKAYELNGATINAGDEGTFYLDHAGRIFSFEKEGSASAKNYALVLSVTDGFKSKATDGVVLADPKVKLLTASGEEITYVLDYADLKAAVVEVNGQDIDVKLEKNDLVVYDLNSDDEIDELTVESKGNRTYDTIKTNVNSFNLSTNAVIFNVPSNIIGDAEVVTVDDLDEKSVTGYKVIDGDEIVALIVTDGAAGQTGIYAIITDDAGTAYDEDEEKSVKLYTAYVNGKEIEYLRHKDAVSGIAAGNDVVKLTLSNGKLKAADVVTGSAVKGGVASNSRVSGSITTDKNVVYYLADDVVVYVVEKDGDVVVGAKSDIRNNEFKVYDTVDNDEDYDIVVVFEK